jgi:hypothetical protein
MLKMKREKTQISKIRNERGEITTNTKEIHGFFRDHFKDVYLNNLQNLDEMEKFLDTCDHPKLNQDDINHLNRFITSNDIEAATESPKKRSRN